jgi:hypothetical protein
MHLGVTSGPQSDRKQGCQSTTHHLHVHVHVHVHVHDDHHDNEDDNANDDVEDVTNREIDGE